MEILSTLLSSQNSIMSWIYRFWLLPKFPARFLRFLFTALILFPVSFLTSGAQWPNEISYSEHCKDIVPEPSLRPNPNPPLNLRSLALRHAYVDYRGNKTKGISVIPRSLSFSSLKAYRTQNDAVLKIEAVLSLIGVRGQVYLRGNRTRRGLRLVKFRPPRIPVTSGDSWNAFRFSLNGFWDWSSGKLCMIGSGFGKFSSDHAVLKLDYLNSSSIFNSLVNGTFERLDGNDNGFNHNLISILGVNLRNYKYELIDKEIANKGFNLLGDSTNISLGVENLGQKVCSYIRAAGSVELKYMSDCSKVSCNFLGGGSNNFTPSVMNFNEIECMEDGRVRFLLGFGEFGHNGHLLLFEPNVTLVSEGKWDEKKRRLNMVGCRIFSDWDEGFVGECLIRLSLRFPAKWTLRDRSSVVGLLWSSRAVNESGYFGSISFASTKNKIFRSIHLKYEYTEIENVRRSCANKTTQKGGGGDFPDGLSSDLRFDMVVGNRKVKDFWGFSSPLYVEDRLYQASPVFDWEENSSRQMKQNHTSVLNVSYVLSLETLHNFKLSSEYMQIKSFEISAEGLYDSKSGHICMVGCLHVIGSPNVKLGRNASLDCEILVDIQYPSLHSKNGGIVKGTIESTRKKFDSLYFEPFEILSRSIYAGQAKESMWRMDLEITMVLISNTLLCFFVSLQLLHVKRHANVLPFISITMLVMLTLAHLIPLLLNFEAFFLVRHNSYFASDGWLEVNEVLVRVITMIAFLLEFRLLQLAWCAKSVDESQKNLWISDKKVVYLSLPMYVCGGLIAWFVHLSRKSYQPLLTNRYLGYIQKSLWGDLKSYTGVILDGFLLPQILFNLFCDTKEKSLSPSFYVGTTFVRLLPHAYDLYRSHSSTWSLNYIYANPRMDYYSTAWDVIISIGGLLFACLVYLQQRYSGGCLLPKRFRQTYAYEKVPVTSAVGSKMEGF